jgi:acetylornithine deacetylase/succinyl-diaminopimelate desuccinylase-like protein
MSRAAAVNLARDTMSNGRFHSDLARRVAIRTVSQDRALASELRRYLESLAADIAGLGFKSAIHDCPDSSGGPILISRRDEMPGAATLLCYGHGDVVRGLEVHWNDGRSPWEIAVDGERIYGRGTADNKGQHTILLLALEAVQRARGGNLGFNVILLIETSEEVGSPGLREFCRRHRDQLRADLLISSDGPRLARDQPIVILGTRGVFSFDLLCDLRESAHHSGNWGGLIANPAVLLSHAIASLVSAEGRIAVRDILPAVVDPVVRHALVNCRIEAGSDGPEIDGWWGEPDLSPAERVIAWTALEVLAFKAGEPEHPVNAIPARAVAYCQLRFPIDVKSKDFLTAIQHHLQTQGHLHVRARDATERGSFTATRLDPGDPAAKWAANSIEATLGVSPVIVPNLGGTLPNDCFALELGMPTLWIPHSYQGCRQHAGDEHLLTGLVEEGLRMMAGLFWDLGDLQSHWWRRGKQFMEASKVDG